jgi:hypothetical protein
MLVRSMGRRNEMDDYATSTATPAASRGGLILASVLVIIAGAFQIAAGLAMLGDSDVFEKPTHYWYDWSITFWGWTHLIMGIVVAVSGIFLYLRKPWAGYFVVGIAGLSAFWNFFFIIVYPFWALTVIAIDLLVIWAVTRPGVVEYWE